LRADPNGLTRVAADGLTPGELQVCSLLVSKSLATTAESEGRVVYLLGPEIHEQMLESLSAPGLRLRTSAPTVTPCHGQFLHRLKRVRFRRGLIGTIPLHPREAQRQPAHITRAHLNIAERNLRHDLRLDIDGVGVAPNLDLQKLLGLPDQHLVSEAFE